MKDPETLRNDGEVPAPPGARPGDRLQLLAGRHHPRRQHRCSTSSSRSGASFPNSWVDVGGLFFIFFSGSPPTETAKYVDPSYTTAHVTFFCKDHQGENIRRIIERVQAVHLRDRDSTTLGIDRRGGQRAGRRSRPSQPAPVWEKAGPSWVGRAASARRSRARSRSGDRIVGVGKREVEDRGEFRRGAGRPCRHLAADRLQDSNATATAPTPPSSAVEGGVQARRRPHRRARGGQRGAGAQRPADELPRLLHDVGRSCCSPIARSPAGSTCSGR